ncbi:hypothetical protein [Natronospora cellulosivora (SeqCode)]
MKKIILLVIILLISIVMVACRFSLGQANLSMRDYNVVEEYEITTYTEEVKDDEGNPVMDEDGNIALIEKEKKEGYIYTISGNIENSGAAGEYFLKLSALAVENDQWDEFGSYGPLEAEIGTNTFNLTITSDLDHRIKKFKIGLYQVERSGERTFIDEFEYTLHLSKAE